MRSHEAEDIIVDHASNPDAARSDNARWAIAYALLRIAESNEMIAERLNALGFNLGGEAPGTTEKIAMALGDVSEHLGQIASAIADHE